MKPIAIVIPWFGPELKGGAEQQAWQVATRLSQRGHNIEVLTTCCRSFETDWGTNYYRPGVTRHSGIKIRRFRVDRRDHTAFDRINQSLLQLPIATLKPGVNPIDADGAVKFCSENINSNSLLKYLKKHQDQYQAFLFIPYLYGPILNGLPHVAERAFLQPCLHNEAYAYLPQIAHIFHLAKGLLFISEGEAQLAKQLFGPGILLKSVVAGAGIEAGQYLNESAFIADGSKERFVLCLGRRDSTKNTDLLVRAYSLFKQKHPDSSLKLLIAGPGSQSFDGHVPGLTDFGLIEEPKKEALLANCLALFQPSQNESYSRVMMEAWFYKKPVAVHGGCLATAMAVESAQGGWVAQTEDQWAELFAKVDALEKNQLAELGVKGQNYANENAQWDKVIEKYEHALGLSQTATSTAKNTIATSNQQRSNKLKEIHQLLPNLAYGDAISNHALAIRDHLRDSGYKSDIFVKYLDEKIFDQGKVFRQQCIDPKAGLIYHHSIGSELTIAAINHPNSKCLIYHNITPAEFFQPYKPEFAKILEQGRLELKQLAQHFVVSVGDSAYNAAELASVGFSQPGVLPISVDPGKWDLLPDPVLMKQLQDGKANLLFVGRLAPNKRQDHLLEAFGHYLTMDNNARLILVGFTETTDPYHQHLLNIIHRLNLQDYILLPGQVSNSQLLAFYQTAHLFWSMSEHEGFCVPLVEAMWFDIPVLAYKSSAVPETLGNAGLMFTNKEDLVQVAALAKLLVRNEELHSKVVKAQKLQRQNFLPQVVHQSINRLITQMENI